LPAYTRPNPSLFAGRQFGYVDVVTTTPEQGSERHHREDVLERGEVFQDAEGRQTADPGAAMENADSENDRNEERLKQGDVGPGIPEK
jgi:hypothetical protein